MRIPTTAEFLTIFVATGRFSVPSMQDAKLSLVAIEPSCDPNKLYPVQFEDICDTIAAAHKIPTYQIICENEQINGQCTNLSVGTEICLGRHGEDCHDTAVVQWPYTSPEAIAEQHHIPLDIFEENNYCHETHDGKIQCPQFHNGQTVCIAKKPIGNLPECPKIFQ